jgi:hypothetical protein
VSTFSALIRSAFEDKRFGTTNRGQVQSIIVFGGSYVTKVVKLGALLEDLTKYKGYQPKRPPNSRLASLLLPTCNYLIFNTRFSTVLLNYKSHTAAWIVSKDGEKRQRCLDRRRRTGSSREINPMRKVMHEFGENWASSEIHEVSR